MTQVSASPSHKPSFAAKPKVGELLKREGLLSQEQITRGLAAHRKEPSVPFGNVCVELGFVSSTDLAKVLTKHHRRIPLGELLLHLGLISTDQLESVLQEQQTQNPRKKLGSLLVEKGLIDEAALIRALYEQSQQANECGQRKPDKFDALVAMGCLDQGELDTALREARTRQRPVETLLMEQYRLSKQEIGAALSAFYLCPFMEYDDRQPVAPDCMRGINLNYLKSNYWIPLQVTETRVEVLIDDPRALDKIRDIKGLFPGKEIKCAVGLREDILKYVNRISVNHDKKTAHESLTAILGQLDGKDEDESHNETEGEIVINENDSAIVRLVNQVITDAWKQRVSDIHIEPDGSQHNTRIRFRVDGRCFEYLQVPAAYRRALVSRLKIMAHLDISERRKPQDGKIRFRLPSREIELRMATIPTAGLANEDVVLRILAAEEPMALDQLRMTSRNLKEFRALLEKPHGLILCAGPTGSGKTTTLHSALGAINTPARKIWTAEDPVEITQRGLRQVQVNAKIGFNFAAAMRAFLRADPDVIMVGEIRDRETAEVGIEASLTGHLVLSTLHTNSAVETVTRLLEMNMDPFNFADALLGVLAQRLARTLCQDCKQSYHPAKDAYDALAYGYGEAAFARLGISYDDRFLLYRGRGCGECRQTGYKGRIGLHELLVVTEEIRKLIHGRATVAELVEIALQQGMTTLVQDGVLKTLDGWTDYAQVKAAAMR
ncbi:MAG: general secretion pathway protein GspE [Deltaproteobacteria bacterium]|nr:general secretion pathway protein GspE [Deltaproteobacteria bacterium]